MKQRGPASPSPGGAGLDMSALLAMTQGGMHGLGGMPSRDDDDEVRGRRNRVVWTIEQDNAFVQAINAHGVGRWAAIAGDPMYCDRLGNKTPKQCSNRWRAVGG